MTNHLCSQLSNRENKTITPYITVVYSSQHHYDKRLLPCVQTHKCHGFQCLLTSNTRQNISSIEHDNHSAFYCICSQLSCYLFLHARNTLTPQIILYDRKIEKWFLLAQVKKKE